MTPTQDFEELRRRARYRIALLHVGQFPGLRLTGIDDAALAAFKATWNAEQRSRFSREWDWENFTRQRAYDHARHELALWSTGITGTTLHALSIGASRMSDNIVTAEYVEVWPFPDHPFKGRVIPISTQVLELYATLVGARGVLLRNVTRQTADRYDPLGYRVESVDYPDYFNLWKDVP